jgi:hypothetical protein
MVKRQVLRPGEGNKGENFRTLPAGKPAFMRKVLFFVLCRPNGTACMREALPAGGGIKN